jgi:hypothetical protein
MAYAPLFVGRHRAVLHESGQQLAEGPVIVAGVYAQVMGEFLEGEGASAMSRQEFECAFLELFRGNLRIGPVDRRWTDQNENR